MFHHCCSRPIAEEWNLATFWHPQDVTNAEFQRTWMSVVFPGAQLRAKLEHVDTNLTTTVHGVVGAAEMFPGKVRCSRRSPEEVH
jgi:hypothetical protein